MTQRCAVHVVLSALLAAPAATQEPGFEAFYQLTHSHPSDASPGFHEDAQGVTHDESSWFFTYRYGVWKIPVTADLGGIPALFPGTVHRTLADYPELGAFDHLGSPAFWRSPVTGSGYVLVPAYGEAGGDDCGTGGWLVALRSDDLAFVDLALLPAQSCAFDLATDPQGRLYSMEGIADELKVYTVNWDALESQGLQVSFSHVHKLKDENGLPLWLDHFQGSDFTPSGELYFLVCGASNCEGKQPGIHVFDTTTWQRVQTSTNGGQKFSYPMSCVSTEYEEACGLTVWDVDGLGAPGISGELHVLLLDNDWPSSDDIWFRHYTNSIFVDPSAAFVPYVKPTVQQAFDWAWDGCILQVEGGAYSESLVLDKRLLLRRNGGAPSVVIG